VPTKHVRLRPGRDQENFVKEPDVQIYAIRIYECYSSRGRTPEELSWPGLLTDISEPTGGRHFVVENLNER
jgi:hypothetical protein